MVKKVQLVFGVGINDSTTSVYSKIVDGKKKMCPYYQTWTAMLRRCYSVKSHQKHPTYTNCTVDPEWHSFTVFRDWMKQQDWQNKELDKDIILLGNTCYSSKTCTFVSSAVNSFLNYNKNSKGKYPAGVVKVSKSSTFMARISIKGKNVHLGNFSTPEKAHQEWKKAKHQQALVLAKQQSDLRVADALSNRFI